MNNIYISFEDLHQLDYLDQEDEYNEYCQRFSLKEEQAMQQYYEERGRQNKYDI